jgi:hypothetical protein
LADLALLFHIWAGRDLVVPMLVDGLDNYIYKFVMLISEISEKLRSIRSYPIKVDKSMANTD